MHPNPRRVGQGSHTGPSDRRERQAGAWARRLQQMVAFAREDACFDEGSMEG
ncbi:hypothetical protein GGTG_00298 [Gaeumannomyces tritici R3-111a-1]|uniref:Uncharacterized protein n=1 Tax=Gaeumannomyces tritici (strain R3-111a-1) TaxID=644352 RepID=J3NGA6_GAET3|nr:hypothetical protein GGTG_00298 [Gaeumannomyces tritici R3-111a-1]EJT80296.1 hypothetical protein GGTG_00298 [Gaeumannomyces tritici R3-111a-1]